MPKLFQGLTLGILMAAATTASSADSIQAGGGQKESGFKPPRVYEIEAWLKRPESDRKLDDPAVRSALTLREADLVVGLIANERLKQIASERAAEIEQKSITNGTKVLHWETRTFGTAPAGGHSLWISMHGGGGAPHELNDQQWRNQIRLYEPSEGIYLAPRAPTDNWNLWHEDHIDPMFDRLIEDYIAGKQVNPNKVYLMGYSAGGDGVWQLGPRMADHFAAAAMMAGHPNDALLFGLRDLPFAIFVGGNDAAYNRNHVAAEKAHELDLLEAADPGGYVHMFRSYDGLGHWMNRKDAEALPWMYKFERDPWPKKIVWCQGNTLHDRFYWLQLGSTGAMKKGQKITAIAEGQKIALTGDVPSGLHLWLSDHLLNLDEPVDVTVNGSRVFSGKVKREAAAVTQSLAGRADPSSAATADCHWD